MKKIGKALSLVLAGSMVVSMLTTSTFAADILIYSDVPVSASYAEAVEYLSTEKIMEGTGGGKFNPTGTVTRAQVVATLGRMAEAKQVETNSFTDITPNSWYSGYVGWAAENGIVQGDGNGHFAPNRMVTSEQLNLILDRYAKSMKLNVNFYDTGATTVSRADLAQRLYTLAKAEKKIDYTTFEFAQTTGGRIRGYKYYGVYTFLGVPYAEAGRFEEPHDAKWDGTKDCATYGPISPQYNAYQNGGNITDFSEYAWADQFEDENCQNLNIWTKSLNSSAKKPVIVWYHGGGYSSGSSLEGAAYDGHNLADYGDVVFVSVNARLGALGYLDLSAYGDEYKNSGNLGMMDNVKALEWVNKNIANFGGDPNNVTIVGQSGGGSKVMSMMGIPSAKGLFQRVWAMSGTQTAGRDPKDSKADAAKLIEQLGLTGNADPVAALKEMRYDELSAACNAAGVRNWGTIRDGEFFLGTVVDGKYTDLAKSYPLVLSTVFSEMGSTLQQMMFVYRDVNSIEQIYSGDAMEHLKKAYGNQAGAIAEAFQTAYPSRDLIDVLTINANRSNDLAIAKANADGNVWQAVFSYKLPVLGGSNSWHTGGDVPFLFHNADKESYLIAGDEANAYAFQDTCADALIAYAYTGDPSTDKLSWPKFTEKNGETMILDVECYVGKYHDAKLLELVRASTVPDPNNPFGNFGGGSIPTD